MNGDLYTEGGHAHFFAPATQAHPGPEPALLLLHDVGGDENALLSVAEGLADHGHANVLALRGFYPSSHGYSFLGPGRDDGQTSAEEVVRDAAGRVAACLAWAAARYEIDPQETVVLGVGEGATLGTALLLAHPETVGGAVLVRPHLPFRPKPLPALPGYPVLLLIGHDDRGEVADESAALQDTLFGCGCDVAHHRVHHLERDFDARLVHVARGWYRRVLKVEETEAKEGW